MPTLIKSLHKTQLLINRNYAFLWFGQSISTIGDFFLSTTLALEIITQLGKGQSWLPLAVSGVTLATTLPSLLVGPLAGVFVDRWDKKQTMMRMDLMRAACVVLLLFLVWGIPHFLNTNAYLVALLQLTAIYLLTALISVCSQFFNPSRLVLIGDIVPESSQVRAVSFLGVSFNVAVIVGPSLATILFFAFGLQWAMLLDIVSFIVSFFAILAISTPETSKNIVRRPSKSFFQELIQGFSFFKGHRVLIALLVTGILANLGIGTFNALYILFVVQNLHTPNALIGLFGSLYGAGVICGLLVAAFLARYMGEKRVLWLSLATWGIFLLTTARLTEFAPALALFFLLGFSNAGLNVSIPPLTLQNTPREFLGRVQAVNSSTAMSSALLAGVLSATLASTVLRNLHVSFFGFAFGPLDTVFTAGGLLSVIAGVYVMLALRARQ